MGTLKFPLLSLLLLHILTTLTWLSPKVLSKTQWEDIQVLKQLKSGLDPNSVIPGSCMSSWDFSFDPCDNLFSDRFTCGFRCDQTDPSSGSTRITEITLDQPGYSGSLTSVPFNSLLYLQTLDLSNNYFHGPIPESLSGLNRLIRLGLSKNSFSGSIPPSIGSLINLEELYLDNNNLQGTIPPNLTSLFSLKRLELQSNRLFGTLPELGSLQSLNFLDLSNNALSGNLKPISFPASLVQISIRNNSLQGTIPETFRNLNYLQVLDLSLNQLANSVPYFLFTHPSLQQLTLSSNNFTSIQTPPLPFISQSQLIAVDLSNNELQGFLPQFLAIMPRLSALSLENNKFTGMIPISYAIKAVVHTYGVSQFERLFLGGNYLFGPIPSPFIGLKEGGSSWDSSSSSVDLKLNGNCLFRCPLRFFFCQGGEQRPLNECRNFRLVIP